MSLRKAITDKVWSSLPEVPTLGSSIDIPVYVIHNGSYKEDYFFIFDFEEFVEKSRSGLFVRPRIQVWSGRDDFDRSVFARQFRESFATEFDAARTALREGNSRNHGWFTWDFGLDVLTTNLSQFLANIILLVALSAGKLALSSITLPKWLKGKSDTQKLEASIQDTQTKVDAALKRMTIRIHPQLKRHAFREEVAPETLKAEDDAWPLPADIAEHLGDGRTRSRW